MLKSYRVFNADQIEGYEPTTGREKGDFGTVEHFKEIETYIKASAQAQKAVNYLNEQAGG